MRRWMLIHWLKFIAKLLRNLESISFRINNIFNKHFRLRQDQQLALQECAIVKITPEEKQMPRIAMTADGQYISRKEDEEDFTSNIQVKFIPFIPFYILFK